MNLASRLAALGYTLQRNQKDHLGRKWPYRTVPSGQREGGGPTNYFTSLAKVARYVAQVEQVRSWQQE